MGVTLAALTLLRHSQIAAEYDATIGQALGHTASRIRLHDDISQFDRAKTIERALATVAGRVAATLSSVGSDSSRGIQRMPDSLIHKDDLSRPDESTGPLPMVLVRRPHFEFAGCDTSELQLGAWVPDGSDPLEPRITGGLASLLWAEYGVFPEQGSHREPDHGGRDERLLGQAPEHFLNELVAFIYAAVPDSGYNWIPEEDTLRAAPGEPVPLDRKYETKPEEVSFVCYPSAPLPLLYHPPYRPWFEQAVRSNGPVWTPIYQDPGTDEAVVTVSTVVKGPNQKPIAVLAVDLSARELQAEVLAGPAKFANFYIVLAASLILLGILYASGRWDRMLYLFFAVGSFVPLYYAKVMFFLFAPDGPRWERAEVSLDVFLSLLNSGLTLLAGFFMFNEVQRRTQRSYRVLASISRWFEKAPATSSFFVISASSILVWTITLVLSNAFGGETLRQEDLQRAYWVDAIVAFLATIYFGTRLAFWGRNFLRWRNVMAGLLASSFWGYGVLQLAYPIHHGQEVGWLFWSLFIGKIITLGFVIAVVFSNTQNYNYIRRQLGSLVKKVYSRGLGTRYFVVLGKLTPTHFPVIAMSRVAATTLGYHVDGETSEDDQRGTRESILGSGEMLEPTFPRDLREHFLPGRERGLDALVNLMRHDWSAGGVKRTSDQVVRLRTCDEDLVDVHFDSLALWRDSHVGTRPLSETYFVGIGRVI